MNEMKREVNNELENFKILQALQGKAKLIYFKPTNEIGNFEFAFDQFKRKKISALYIKITAAASAAALVLGLVIWNIKKRTALEEFYYAQQTEWIALSDEALLTDEYIKLLKLKSNSQHKESDLPWIDLE